MLVVELFAKAFWRFETCVSVNNNLRGKLVLSLEPPVTFDESFKVTWVPFFIPYFSLLRCELDNFRLKVLYWVIFIWYHIKGK